MMLLSTMTAQAQITIKGNVYGGGNAGKLGGKTEVLVYGGDIHQVYGGARQADVEGSTFVHIDGEHASKYIVIDKLFGGNDIAGNIGTSDEVPSELTAVGDAEGLNNIDNTWNTFVRTSTKTVTTGEGDNAVTTEADGAQKIYIGQLFGGGNGDYDYTSETSPYKGKTKPEIGKSYLELCGASIVYAYGGGNNATATEDVVIYVDNPSKVVSSITDATNPNADDDGELLTTERFRTLMGINTGLSYPSSSAFQIGRMFGGNNKADMAIRPTWNLKAGKIRNLYSGGNQGRMTSPEGLLLEIRADATIKIDNVYGGCRMADVRPLDNNGDDVLSSEIQLHDVDEEGNPKYKFPTGLSARVIVRGGDINNVYGGNDITGRIYGGNAVGVYASVKGDVYGGGNGSYPYTDNADLIGHDVYGDLYYTIPDGKTSAEALNDFRPNAEQVSIRLTGTESKPTVIGGAVYCGGNSATLKTVKAKPLLELKIGSYVIADNVFLGNNGANMIKTDEGVGLSEGVLRTMKRTDITDDASKFNSMDLTDANTFATYMNGVAMDLMPSVVFDDSSKGDHADYIDYSTMFGSIYCGGNVGSMTGNGKTAIEFTQKVIVFEKVVGGCNNAFVTPVTGFNAIYEGGLTGSPDEKGDKLQLNFDGLKIQPKRWNEGHTELIWNTVDASGAPVDPKTEGATPESPVTSTDEDLERRFDGGNIYGGCYNSGFVNGNVIININSSIVDREILFDTVEEDESGEDKLYGNDQYHITKRNSGVILSEQGMDVLGKALNVFGGGKGVNTEIWGSTTINLNRGYVFQIFGGSEEGGIGNGEYNESTGKIEYTYNPKYSTYINLNGPIAGVSRKDNMTEDIAECEFMYGGGFLGPVAGNCIINLDNGRIFDSFAGSCNADILGHTETYIGTKGFPYVRDFVYGGNDLGGQILGTADFDSRLRNDAVRSKVTNAEMLNASAYMEYVQGRVEKIFGGAYGVYNYKDSHYRAYFDEDGHAKTGYHKPFLGNAFINFRPNDTNNPLNTVEQIYGAGQGFLGEEEEDLMQNSSYILIDVPQTMTTYQGTEIFGAGESGGVGMGVAKATAADPATAHQASAIIDLLSGHFKAVYGGSYQEGVTRRTVVNVPEGSTFRAEAIFGGAYGLYNEYRCDVYESNVNWNSSDALVGGFRTGIYGGNNSYRRTLYSHVNINAPVYYDKGNEYFATVYGAGYGKDTWAQYTEVNLNNTALVYEVYGGGQLGRVMNKKSVDAWAAEANGAATAAYTSAHAEWDALPEEDKATTPEPQAPHAIELSLGAGYTDNGLNDALAEARDGKKYNTNVLINQGADVCGYMYNGSLSGAYAYGGGLGDANTPNTGDVHGTTYIALLGGRVTKDIYAAGTVGSVNNKYRIATDDFDEPFIASANAYIEGGTARNVYGGGWRGSVGYHVGAISDSPAGDVLGETNVVIGKCGGTSFIDGIPAIERNAYGGGEGGPVFGTANITVNNGFIGYRHFDAVPTTDTDLDYIQVGSDYYQEKLHDETWSGDGTNRLYDSGCVFGGGYIDNSSVDVTNLKMYGGVVRNALFGGGEIAAIGRGVIEATGVDNSVRTLKGIYKAGKANVTLFEGDVHRNVFGGGRGYNNLGEGGTLYSDGYVFGQTEVHVHGGTIGTAKELARENGNVFGGGDIGYVYSAYEDDGKLYVGVKDGERYDDGFEGYYYAYYIGTTSYDPTTAIDDSKWVKDEDEFVLTEDCKVLIEPYCKATSAVTVNDHAYAAGEYVTTEDLHTLGNKNDGGWDGLDLSGITIFNAVFAGGNTSSGSSTVYANTTTVFGNATASIHDVYHRDLITLGTGHTGGLYGDGNLTFVDGYRGLNITNYGTDYYSLSPEITIEQYNQLPEREADYYQLKYKCIKECIDKDGTTYHIASGEGSKASTLTIDDLLTVFEGIKDGDVDLLLTNSTTGEKYPNPIYWEQNGVVPVYAGRLMNTIQRADFCGVFGSRMVMQGAQDRVPEIVDHTNYTINRVREVSLNQKHSVRLADESDESKAVHGNYFGIYSIVNYLGALTSDVFFLPSKDVRVTDNASNPDFKTASKAYNNGDTSVESKAYGTATYYDWKAGFVNDRKRNNGTSKNKVALASGVYLELTTEQSTGDGLNEKDWGYITGVVELDLINVQPGMGGGFVYAKNVHKTSTYTQHKHNTLTELNNGAVTRRDFTYTGADVEWETSGNFVHSTQTIIDDCYNISGKYKGSDAVPAHYWFIKGSVYVYDQYISAYTGAPNAYSETVDIPLTITAASHGTMKLLNVMPNKYAYYSAPGVKLEEGKKIVINEVEYHLNDPINYWDWYLLTSSEKNLFVDETYVTTADCKYNSADANVIPAGTVMLPAEYNTLKTAHPTVYHVEKQENVDFDFVYRSSNNMSHDTGYMLTYKVNNPTGWNTWYTEVESATAAKNQTGGSGYEDGPTYHLKNTSTGGVLGQREYQVSNLIAESVYTTYNTMKTAHPKAVAALGDQAEFEQAYIVTKDYTNGNVHLNVGSSVSKTQADDMDGYVAPAFISTSTIQLSKTEYIYVGNRMTAAEKEAYKTAYPALADIINADIVPAYYCKKDGLYGGNYYEANKNYRGLEVWSSMSETDREQFEFNYDAFDVLIDPRYGWNAEGTSVIHPEGKKYQYDSAAGTEAAAKLNPAGYSLENPVNYSATYNGDETSTHNGITLEKREYTRTEYESLPNEKRHYTSIDVKAEGEVYVVNTSFQVGNSPYAVGTVISSSTYSSLGDTDKANITTLTFTADDVDKTYYYCRESYKVGENTEGVTVTNAPVTGSATGTYTVSSTEKVPIGLVIDQDNYNSLPNWQTDFTIHGVAPTETSTLYVSRFSDIFDLSKEKIITVIYEYNYEESDGSGTHVTPVSERHVVNIHVVFKSGIPYVEDIKAPQIVLPGTFVGVREPHVTPGAYEVTGGGWKLFEKKSDAESHINGVEYTPTADPLYWYQHGFYLAYYAKTYLGETYSNAVQVSVANYHDLTKVLNDTEHYYYVDNPTVKRNSKIYITDATNGATQLKQFFDLTSGSPAVLNPYVENCQNLEFILHTNVTVPSGSPTWTPIGEDGHCFSGNFHGDGYHIDGLDNSLFGRLCGNVYNLGVTGSFTSAGVADTGDGYVENCWINTSATSGFPAGVKAVFGNPTAKGKKIVNCYYPEGLAYSTTDDTHGLARPMPQAAFYNGTVAYDLNGFYLYKRYNNTKTGVGQPHTFYTINTDGTLSEPTTMNYVENNAIYCSSGIADIYRTGAVDYGGYVEQRYGDGDFRYADGVIPESEDERTLVDADDISHFYPIWPDDYFYFGQMLTYNWNNQRPHEDVPSHIVKNNGRLSNTDESNRIFRAPAYYQSKVMYVAHFNPVVNLVAYSKPKTSNDKDLKAAYPNMTAIDFAGHNDTEWTLGRVSSASSAGVDLFYQPLLDENGLKSITNRDETPNLLVYAPSEEANKNTFDVLTGYFTEPAYSDYYNDSDPYRRVSAAPTWIVFGHLVQSNLKATSDQLLVDKKDFNCPLSYTFDTGKRMWHQRIPDNYVSLTKGWSTVSLPFTAELVSTQDKGEITHFYSGSPSVDANGTKVGHEYWLSAYNGQKANTNPETDGFFTAAFNYPTSGDVEDKQVDNTFLWDYYYSKNVQKDANTDIYQTRYQKGRTMTGYQLLSAAQPYMIGFPGKTFYEFDLSGEFVAKNTATTAPAQLDKQTISFVSEPEITIAVSDDETSASAIDGYKFMPNYMSKKVVGYLMNQDGNSFNITPDGGSASVPFRPYFVTDPSSGVKEMTRSIAFDTSIAFGEDKDPSGDDFGEGNLVFTIHNRTLCVTSTLKNEADVHVYSVSGLLITTFTIQPGETVNTNIPVAGVYIIRAANGRIQKKIAIK